MLQVSSAYWQSTDIWCKIVRGTVTAFDWYLNPYKLCSIFHKIQFWLIVCSIQNEHEMSYCRNLLCIYGAVLTTIYLQRFSQEEVVELWKMFIFNNVSQFRFHQLLSIRLCNSYPYTLALIHIHFRNTQKAIANEPALFYNKAIGPHHNYLHWWFKTQVPLMCFFRLWTRSGLLLWHLLVSG